MTDRTTAIQWNKVSFAVRQGFWMTSRTILQDIELEVPEASVLGLVGPNGAGKTTTIKLGAGLLEPAAGEALIFGQPSSEAGARTRIGLLTETQYIYPHLRLGEWLVMLAGFSGMSRSRISERMQEVVAILELNGRENQMMRTLSKGQLQRAGLAQALIHEPDILLLDEPMSGLDPYWRYRFQQIFLDFKNSGKTILFSSHILHDVEKLSDQIALIQEGRLQWKGRLTELPRELKGYEAICRTDDAAMLEKLVTAENMTCLPDGEWRVSLSISRKEDLLRLASEGSIQLEALSPVRQEVEEVLFGFSRKSGDPAEKGEVVS